MCVVRREYYTLKSKLLESARGHLRHKYTVPPEKKIMKRVKVCQV